MTSNKNLTNLTPKKNTMHGHLSVRLPIHLFNKIDRKAYNEDKSFSKALRELLESTN